MITLTGKQGSGKTRFAFQFMNALAQRYRVGHASIEEHPESVLYEEKAYQYLNDTALEHITAQDVRSLAELDTMIHTNEVIVIDSFQKCVSWHLILRLTRTCVRSMTASYFW